LSEPDKSGDVIRAIAGLAAALGLAFGMAGCGSVSTLAEGRQISTTPHCTEFAFAITFPGGSAELTKKDQALIRDAGAHTKGCTVASVEVIGLSDTLGLSEASLALARRRADRLAPALTEAGLSNPAFKLSPMAEAGAVATDDGPKPGRRRVSIIIRFAR
jgi:outer membrane protein OmpA-like peptidoglycan-associated protein